MMWAVPDRLGLAWLPSWPYVCMCVCVLWALRVQQLLLHIQQQWLQHQRQQQQTAMAGAI